jgi:hypothetical protein
VVAGSNPVAPTNRINEKGRGGEPRPSSSSASVGY